MPGYLHIDGLRGATGISLWGLSQRGHRIFTEADVRVTKMMTLPAFNTEDRRNGQEEISLTFKEMFEEAEFW
ncbi:DinI family protein [Salmonella enterica]|uniref:DinI family protein n=1 Tax=Salmonella enterica TaxID=28901 RepID=UPI00398C2D2D